MSDEIEVTLAERATVFRPGDEVRGTVRWHFEQPPEVVRISLLWYTEGKGDSDTVIVEAQEHSRPSADSRADFRFTLPDHPYSFSGKLISLSWQVEALALPQEASHAAGIVLGPDAREVDLHQDFVQPERPVL